MRVVLINGPLKSAVCDFGVGHQMPLGLLMVGGPLLKAGHTVKLIDAACDHLSDAELVHRVNRFNPDVAMIAHVGSTTAHTACLRSMRALKNALPHVVTVYGGVHPTYHYKEILRQHPYVDLVVRGEGEATALDLVNTLSEHAREVEQHGLYDVDLSQVQGIAWRRNGEVVMNSPRPPLHDLDTWPIGYELVEDWDKYKAFTLGRAAVVQFSRGCPHTCTYCGQWMFWKRWRHRDVQAFVDQVEHLHRQHDVNFFWLADENPTTIKSTWKAMLAEIARRNLPIKMCASIRAQDIVRDADILHLYRAAGFTYVLMGIEAVTDEKLAKIRKGSLVDDGFQAVRLLRKHNIMSIVDYIFGIDDETPRTLWLGLRGLLKYDGDFVNALYITPHTWTPMGRDMKDAPIVEEDTWRWDYRHQIVGVKHLTPGQLFAGVKLVELVYHLHPRRLLRILTARDPQLRQQLRYAFVHTSMVYWYEIFEFVLRKLRQPKARQAPQGVKKPQPQGRLVQNA